MVFHPLQISCNFLLLDEMFLCCRYEFQMQYGSIGWSVGATLGYAQAAKDKRVIACIGDGSFQVSAFTVDCGCTTSRIMLEPWNLMPESVSVDFR